MNKSLKYLLALVACSALALVAQAQPAPRILVVDMAALLDGHHKTLEQNEKLRADGQKAQEEFDRLNKEGNVLVEQYKELVEQANNPTASDANKARVQADAQRKMEEIQRKQGELQAFQQNTQRALQGRIRTFRDLMFEEIGKIATDIARRKGATLLLDKSGLSLIGITNIVYSDPALDITEEVMREINKDRPANLPSPAPAASPGADSPRVSLPLGGRN
jgi:outer membrane protein